MQTRHVRTLIGVLVAGLFLPFQAQAETNAELLKRIEALSQELTRLKGQVEANNAATTANRQATEELKERVVKAEDKSSERWLTIGGDYQFRVDSLWGETKTFTDVSATFANAQAQLQANFFANPTSANGAALADVDRKSTRLNSSH